MKTQEKPRAVRRKAGQPAAPNESAKHYTQADLERALVVDRAAREMRPVRKICILGTTPSRVQAPFGDDTWEMWTIGPGGIDANRWDALFELHGEDTWPTGFKRKVAEMTAFYDECGPDCFPLGTRDHLAGLKKLADEHGARGQGEAFDAYLDKLSKIQPETRQCGDRVVTKRVYTSKAMNGWASNVVFPKQQIIDKYLRQVWFSSSISFLLGLALDEGATEIGLYGIDLESSEEYCDQWAGAAHMIDLAILSGVPVHMPAHCGLRADPAPYPDRWETVPALHMQSKVKYLEPQLQARIAEREQLALDISKGAGAIEALNYVLQNVGESDVIKKNLTEIEAVQGRRHAHLGTLTNEIHIINGELGAFRHMIQRFVWTGGDPVRLLDLKAAQPIKTTG